MSNRPLVSVLLTTHNGAAFLPETLAGIFGQSFPDFELIAVDDASNDATAEILASCPDPRLRVITSGKNLGVVGARNIGFAPACGRYLALHDHDDISLPGRLARQVSFLEQHASIVLVATEVLIRREGRDQPPDHSSSGDPLRLRWNCLTDNPITYSSVMLRMDAARQLGAFMRPDFEYADDFDLYHRLLRIGDIARLPETLTIYRWHASNTTHDVGARLDSAAARVLCDAYKDLLGDDDFPAACLAVRHLCNRHAVPDRQTLDRLGHHLRRLLTAFLVRYCTSAAERAAIEAEAGRTWWRLVRAACRRGNPGLMRAYSAHRPLVAGFRATTGDITGSLLAGTIRRAGLSGKGNPA